MSLKGTLRSGKAWGNGFFHLFCLFPVCLLEFAYINASKMQAHCTLFAIIFRPLIRLLVYMSLREESRYL